MWMVRAGEDGYLFEEFQRDNYIAIGWNALGDLTKVDTPEQIRQRYLEQNPAHKAPRANNAIAMIVKFRLVLKRGDRVTTYNPETRQYMVGTVDGDYRYAPDRPNHQVRAVKWDGLVDRDRLTPSTRNTLGSTLAVFRLNDDAAEDVLSILHGGGSKALLEAEEEDDLEQLKEDTIGRAHELIKDRILRLSDSDMEQLVAAVLRAMGYKARVTPKGPDRGVDVIASPDGLGLEEPRIKAEVKHRPKTPMGSQQIRSFLGGLRQGDRGLYVSTGGFSKDAGYEADRSNIPVTLLALDDLATLVVSHYENFDMDGKVLIPLTRLYWPAE
ncbi:MAG: restriction endonuclease [Planctomycetaceae bacterium]|nr:restriction endonuclease [Planctomycetaceae bacterium]